MAGDFYADSKFYKKLPAGSQLGSDDLLLVVVGETLSGKTALVNALQYPCVTQGYWVGSTVPRVAVDVNILGRTVRVLDMPGSHGVTPAEIEELLRWDDQPDHCRVAVLCVVNGDAMARTLPFILELTEFNVPLIVGLRDSERAQESLRLPKLGALSTILGIPFVDDIGERCLDVKKIAQLALVTPPPSFTLRYNPSVEMSVREVSRELRFNTARWLSLAAIQGMQVSLPDGAQVKATQQNLRWRESGLNIAEVVAVTKVQVAQGILTETDPQRQTPSARNQKIGNLLARPAVGIPVILVVALLLLHLAFGLATPWMVWCQSVAAALAGIVQGWGLPDYLQSYLNRGLIAGLGSFVGFVPLLFAFYLVLGFLAQSGMAARWEHGWRVLFRYLGIAETASASLFESLGCSVSGLTCTRSLPTPGNQLRTALAVPLIPCAGKLGAMACLAAILCPGWAAMALVAIYVAALLLAMVVLLISKTLETKLETGASEEASAELPPFCLPNARIWMRSAWNRTKSFVVVAFIPVLVVLTAVWGLVFTKNMEMAAGWFAWFFQPLGLGDWRLVATLISGLFAKEALLSTAALSYLVNDPSPVLTLAQGGVQLLQCTLDAIIGTLQAFVGFFSWGALQGSAQLVSGKLAGKLVPLFSPAQSAALLVFVAYCPPCFTAFLSSLKFLGGKYALIQGVGQLVLAWVLALVVGQVF